MIEFDFIRAHDAMLEIAEMVSAHEQEVRDYGDVNVDWNYYLSSSMSGQCLAVVVKDDGHLIGYSVFMIDNNPNHRHIIEANNVGIFLIKKYRGKIGLEMFDYAQKRLSQMGVNEINYMVKSDRIGKLLGRMGYEPEHTLWSIKV